MLMTNVTQETLINWFHLLHLNSEVIGNISVLTAETEVFISISTQVMLILLRKFLLRHPQNTHKVKGRLEGALSSRG